jgi:hypothetical protein
VRPASWRSAAGRRDWLPVEPTLEQLEERDVQRRARRPVAQRFRRGSQPPRRQAEAALDVLANAAELMERALHIGSWESTAREAQLAAVDRVERRVACDLDQPRAHATDIRDLARHDVKVGENALRKVVSSTAGRKLVHGLNLYEVEDDARRIVKELSARKNPIPADGHERT